MREVTEQMLILVVGLVAVIAIPFMVYYHIEIKALEQGLQECLVRTGGYTSTVWQRECQEDKP